MKIRRLISLTLALLLLTAALFSCKIGSGSQGGGTNDGGNSDNGNSGSGREERIAYSIIVGEGYSGSGASELLGSLNEMKNATAQISPDSEPEGERELVIGDTCRDITARAKSYFERLEKEGEHQARYVVYSDGQSVAIAFEEDYFGLQVAEDTAVELFCEKYVSGRDSLTLKKGLLFYGIADALEAQREKDAEAREVLYSNFFYQVYTRLGDKALAEEVTQATREYLDLMTPNMVSWAANLYAPEIGGFYYSNSARDTLGYLPDLESTGQMLALLSDSILGLMNHLGGSAGFPDWMKEQLAAFVKPLQDPNGFFYHPQWDRLEDQYPERRGRDQSWALSILGVAGVKPTYTVGARLGDGMLIDGTRVDANGNVIEAAKPLTSRLGNGVPLAVSAVLSANASGYVDPDLASAEAFREYLEEGNIRNNSYGFGNQLAARTDEFLRREKQLQDEKAGWSVKEILITYLKENQNPENGAWYWKPLSFADRSYYDAVNGLLKTSALYTAFGVEMPYAMEACKTAINGIYSAEVPIHVCDIYNPWFAVQNVFKNLTSCSSKAYAEEKIAEIRNELMLDAPNAIRKTAEKIAKHKKDDGSFSYLQESSSPTSQYMQVAVKGSDEGDVNATIICYIDIANRMFDVLGLSRPTVLGRADWYEFITIMENLGAVIKDDLDVGLEPITFDDDEVGTVPLEMDLERCTHKDTMTVVEDDRKGSFGNVFMFSKTKGTSDALRITSDAASLGEGCLIYESELCFKSGGSVGYVSQITLGEAYMIGVRLDEERAYFFDSSTAYINRADNDYGYSVPLDTWFKFRVEYYYGDQDTVRIKVYANTSLKEITEGDLIAVSDNYYDYYGTKLDTGRGKPSSSYGYVQLVGMSTAELTVLMDNVIIGKTRDTYKRSDVRLPLNVDYFSEQQKVYGFDEPESEEGYPYDLAVLANSDRVEVISKPTAENAENKVLSLVGNKGKAENGFTLEIPTLARELGANCTVAEAELCLASAEVGAKIELALRQYGSDFLEYPITGFHISVIEENGEKLIVINEASGGKSGNEINGIRLPAAEAFTLRTEFYKDKLATLFYVNGELLGTSGAICSGAHKYNTGKLVISNLASGSFELLLDNVKVEKVKKSFDAATKPSVDRIVHGFSGEDSGVTLGGGATVSAGTAVLSGEGSYVGVELNNRSVISGAVVFEARLNVDGGARIELLDGDNNEVIVYELIASENEVYIYEVTERCRYAEPIASFAKGRNTDIAIEWYIPRDVIQIYINGECKAISSLQYSEGREELTVTDAEVALLNGRATVDNLVLEAYNKYYNAAYPDGENTEDGEDILTFESSTGSNIPKPITATLKTGGAAVRIDEMTVAGERSKVFILSTYSGDADYVDVSVSEKSWAGYDCLVLEADVRYNANGSLYLYFYNGSTVVYRINLNVQSRIIHIDDNPGFPPYGTMGNPQSPVASVDWFRLRIELYNTEGKTMAARIALNGKYFAESKEPSWQALVSDITRLQMATASTSVGELMLDNVYLGPGVGTITPDEGGDGEETVEETEGFTDSSVSSVGGGVTNSTVSVTTNSEGAAVKIEDKGEGDKYLSLNTKGAKDTVKILPTFTAKEGYNVFVFEADMKLDTYTVINLFGNDSSAFANRRIYFYPDGTTVGYDVLGTWGKSSLITLGEWFKIKIEATNTEEGYLTVKVYIGGEVMTEVTNTAFTNSIDSVAAVNIYTFSASNGNISLDNVRAGLEKKYLPKPVTDFEDASVSEVGGKVENTTVTVTANENSSVTIAEEEGNKYFSFAVKGSGNKVIIQPTHTEVSDTGFFVFEAYTKINTSTVFNFFTTADDTNRFQIYVDGANLRFNSAWNNQWPTTKIPKDTWFKLRFEIEGDVFRVLGDGNLIYETAAPGSSANVKQACIYTFSGSNGNIVLDNLKVGFEEKPIEKPVTDFENSTVEASGAVTESTVTVTPNASSSASIAGEEDKYLDFAVVGSGNSMVILPTHKEADSSGVFVLEAEIKINTATVFNFFNTYDDQRIYFYADGGKVGLNTGCDGKWISTEIEADTWFRLRIELEGTAVRVYADGTLLHEASGSGDAAKISKVNVYTFSSSKGNICLDELKVGYEEVTEGDASEN